MGTWRTILAAAASAVVPGVLLHTLAGEDHHATGLAAAPFATPGLFVAHMVSALPAGWMLVRFASCVRPVAAAGAGVLVVWAVATLGPFADSALGAAGAGFLARALLRSALAAALVAPGLAAFTRPGRGTDRRPGSVAALTAALIAVLPPMAYAHRTIALRSTEATADLDTGRLVRAERALRVLAQIGSTRPVSGAPPNAVLNALRPTLDRRRRAVSRPLGPGATAKERLERAFELTQLERLDGAAALLAPAVDADASDLDAALLLAAIERDRGRYAESARLYRRVLDVARPRIAADRSALTRCSTAFDGLVDALKSEGRSAEAGRILLEARATLPDRSAYYAVRLAANDLDAGRTVSALAWIDEALRRDPTLVTRIRPLIRRARLQTPACLAAP